jgi:hypothetical protein
MGESTFFFASRGVKIHGKIDPTRRDLRGGEVGSERGTNTRCMWMGNKLGGVAGLDGRRVMRSKG